MFVRWTTSLLPNVKFNKSIKLMGKNYLRSRSAYSSVWAPPWPRRTKCQVLSRKLGLVPQFRVLPSWLKAR